MCWQHKHGGVQHASHCSVQAGRLGRTAAVSESDWETRSLTTWASRRCPRPEWCRVHFTTKSISASRRSIALRGSDRQRQDFGSSSLIKTQIAGRVKIGGHLGFTSSEVYLDAVREKLHLTCNLQQSSNKEPFGPCREAGAGKCTRRRLHFPAAQAYA